MTKQEYMELLDRNIVGCDVLIERLLKEIEERKNVLFIDQLTDAVAKLMTARAAYRSSQNLDVMVEKYEKLDDYLS